MSSRSWPATPRQTRSSQRRRKRDQEDLAVPRAGLQRRVKPSRGPTASGGAPRGQRRVMRLGRGRVSAEGHRAPTQLAPTLDPSFCGSVLRRASVWRRYDRNVCPALTSLLDGSPGGAGIDPQRFGLWLKPESAKWWAVLRDFWDRDSSGVGASLRRKQTRFNSAPSARHVGPEPSTGREHRREMSRAGTQGVDARGFAVSSAEVHAATPRRALSTLAGRPRPG